MLIEVHLIEVGRSPKHEKNNWDVFIILWYSLRENNEILSFPFQFNSYYDNSSLCSWELPTDWKLMK